MTASAPPPDRGPGIRVPPPVIYAIPFLTAWAIHRVLPLPISPDDAEWLDALGLLLIVAWFVLLSWAFWTMVNLGATVRPDRPTTVLVTTGPFAVSRNPIYLSFNALYLGLTLILNSAWPLIGFPFALYVMHRYVIGAEERYLRGAFGERYEDYRRRVRRWL
jgi:protein-S-isoprenylcysteine O-methyltransferase Ste14